MNISNEPTELKVSFDTEKVYPGLEDLIVKPTMEEQHFKSDMYGYDNITVGAIESESLDVTPTMNVQRYEGLFDVVTVDAIETEELNITPSEEEQVKEGLFDKVSVEAIQTEEKNVELDFSNTDTVEVTPTEGSYLNKVTINKDPNKVPENIAKDVMVDGIVGTHQGGTDTTDATATADDILSPRTAYVNGEKVTGTMSNNGALNYTPTTEAQTIPAGYTSGGIIEAINYSVEGKVYDSAYVGYNDARYKSLSINTRSNNLVLAILYSKGKQYMEGEGWTTLIDTTIDSWYLCVYYKISDVDGQVEYTANTNNSNRYDTFYSLMSFQDYSLVPTDIKNSDTSELPKSVTLTNVKKGDLIICTSIYNIYNSISIDTDSETLKTGGSKLAVFMINEDVESVTINSSYSIYGCTTLKFISSIIELPRLTSEVNLLPENIKAGVTIFDVTGTYEGGILEEVNYIQSAGEGEYIDTEIVPTSTTEVEIKFIDVDPFLAYERIFSIDKQFGIMRNDSSSTSWKVECGNKWDAGEFSMESGKVHTLKMGKGIITLNGSQACTYSGSPNTSSTLWLFHGNGTDRNSSIKLYYCNIYEDGELVRSFIPHEDENRVACLLDTLTSQIYYNIGSGTVTFGTETI